jgi:hypothetical protein
VQRIRGRRRTALGTIRLYCMEAQLGGGPKANASLFLSSIGGLLWPVQVQEGEESERRKVCRGMGYMYLCKGSTAMLHDSIPSLDDCRCGEKVHLHG